MRSPTGPALGRSLLLRVLALPDDASPASIRAAARHLADWLERRRDAAEPQAVLERAALDRELADLTTSTDFWTRADRTARPPRARSAIQRLEPGALVAAAVVALALLLAHAAGYRVTQASDGERPVLFAANAWILLDGRLEPAKLRVFDADRSEILAEAPAQGARIELPPGRYALEVRREDCPDAWTRSVFLEPGTEHRFAPELCAGHGQLIVRGNAADDRLRIDELDVGHTGDRSHRLPVGDHVVRVDKTGFRPFEARVRIAPDQSVELRADLVPLAEGEQAGRPIPVSKVAPSLPPIESTSAAATLSKKELQAEMKAPPLEPPDLGLPRRGDFLMREGLPAMPDGGSTAWHDRVSKDLRDRFDVDRSGEIDTLAESEAIPCTVWREIERDFDRGGLGLSLAHYFGFDGSEWHPGALGVARAHRSAVYAKMRECGLDP